MDSPRAHTATMATIQSVIVMTRTSYSTRTGAPLSLLTSLVEPYPAPRLHSRRLDRCVGVLQAMPERSVLGRGEPVHGLSFEGSELCGQVCQLAGEVLGGVRVVAGSTHRDIVRAAEHLNT